MSYEILWAEGFDLDSTGNSFRNRYPQALLKAGTYNLVPGRTDGQALQGLSTFDFDASDSTAPYGTVGEPLYYYSEASGLANKKFGVSFWANGGLPTEPLGRAPFIAFTNDNVTTARGLPLFELRGDLDGKISLTAYSIWTTGTGQTTVINMSSGWSGWRHIEVQSYITISGSTITNTVNAYFDGVLIGSVSADTTNYSAQIRLKYVIGSPRNSTIDSLVFYTGDLVEEQVGPLEVNKVGVSATNTNTGWTNSAGTTTNMHQYVDGTDLTVTSEYVQTNTNADLDFSIVHDVPLDAEVKAYQACFKSTQSDTGVSTLHLLDGNSVGGYGAGNFGVNQLLVPVISMPALIGVRTSGYVIPSGQQVYQSPANYDVGLSDNWTVPANVYSFCVVGISKGGYGTRVFNNGGYSGTGGGGGGLGWRNNIPVTPGEVINVSISAGAGGNGLRVTRVSNGELLLHVSNANGQTPGNYIIAEGGGRGGFGGSFTSSSFKNWGGNGGAGGYLGNGGDGNSSPPAQAGFAAAAGSGGGGGSGSISTSLYPPTSIYVGGGVGRFGIGATGGSSSANGVPGSGGVGAHYGGGYWNIPGQSTVPQGIIRIIWGEGRSFPYNAA